MVVWVEVMAARVMRSGQILDIFPTKRCMRVRVIKLDSKISVWATASLNLSLIIEERRAIREVGGLGEWDGDEYQKLGFGHLSLVMTLSGDTE